jgi:hypothetical protein
MEITAERFEALLDGSARNVTGEERVVRVEAFMAERRGEDPLTAVQSRLPHVLVTEAVEVAQPIITPATNIASAPTASLLSSVKPHQTDAVKRVCWLAFIGLGITVSWFAAYAGFAAAVGHFIAAAMAGFVIQGVVWFFRAPDRS